MSTKYRIYRTKTSRLDIVALRKKLTWPTIATLVINAIIFGTLAALWYHAQK